MAEIEEPALYIVSGVSKHASEGPLLFIGAPTILWHEDLT